MKIDEAFDNVNRVFIDTAPVVYYVQKHVGFFGIAKSAFDWIDKNSLLAITSPVTLAECLVLPMRQGLVEVQQDFFDFFMGNMEIFLDSIMTGTGKEAAKIRSKYHLSLPDALQVAVALQTSCEALLTNDLAFKRVNELRIILLSELEP